MEVCLPPSVWANTCKVTHFFLQFIGENMISFKKRCDDECCKWQNRCKSTTHHLEQNTLRLVCACHDTACLACCLHSSQALCSRHRIRSQCYLLCQRFSDCTQMPAALATQCVRLVACVCKVRRPTLELVDASYVPCQFGACVATRLALRSAYHYCLVYLMVRNSGNCLTKHIQQ